MVTRAVLSGFILNPILVKETRRTTRTLKFLIPMYVVTALLSALLVLIIASSARREILPFAAFIPFLYPLGAALRAFTDSCAAISNEHRDRTFDLLRITALKPWEIIWGKLSALLVPLLVAFAVSSPLAAICSLLGCLSPGWFAVFYVNLFLLVAGLAVLGIALSALLKNTVAAAIVGFALFFSPFSYATPASLLLFIAPLMKNANVAVTDMMAQAAYGLTIMQSIAIPALLFIVAVAIISPRSMNRTTHLRIWYAAFVLTFTALFCLLNARALSGQLYVGFLVGLVAVPGVCAAVGFCGEPARLSERLQTRFGPNPPLWRIFAPGGRTAGALVRVVTLLAILMVIAIAIVFNDSTGLTPIFTIGLAICVYVHFCCTLATAARALWDSPWVRIVTAAVLFAMATLPLLAFLWDTHTVIASASPFGALFTCIALAANGQAGTWPTSAPCFFLAFHLVASLLVFLVRHVHEERKGRRAAPIPVAPIELSSGGG